MAVASPVALHRLWGAWVSEVAALRLSSVGSVVVLQGHVGCSRTSEWTRVPCIVDGFLPTAPPSKSYFVAFFLHEVFIMYIIYKSYYYSSFSCETTSSEDIDLKGWILLLSQCSFLCNNDGFFFLCPQCGHCQQEFRLTTDTLSPWNMHKLYIHLGLSFSVEFTLGWLLGNQGWLLHVICTNGCCCFYYF